jgi:hypothetical protein
MRQLWNEKLLDTRPKTFAEVKIGALVGENRDSADLHWHVAEMKLVLKLLLLQLEVLCPTDKMF